MTDKTAAIVLRSIKYGDSSLIVTCYTKCCGLKTYLLKGILKAKRAKFKAAHFQILTQLNLSANHNNKGALNSIRDLEVGFRYSELHTSITKQSIALFIGEVLFSAIKEEEQNTDLYNYLETALLWLDTHESISNFHLLFLLNLTKFLGCYPKTENKDFSFFDLMEGKFVRKPSQFTIANDQLVQFKRLLGINFDEIHKVEFSAKNRQEILTILIQYFELHLSGFKKPKSLEILKTVFS